jgi:uncharacterized membrane protein YphA (DoxX/SURF4 family)
MNIALWIAQGLVGAMYLMSGTMKTFQTARAKGHFPWARNLSDEFVRFVGVSELLGAFGLILPILTGILPWLTPIAATGLSLIQLLVIFKEHLPKREYNVIPMNLVLLGL